MLLLVMEPKVYYQVKFALGSVTVFNLNSNITPTPFFQQIYPLNVNIKGNPGNLDDFELDQVNIANLITNDISFASMMDVVDSIVYGDNVVILIYDEESIVNSVSETFLKTIQKRYGLNYQVIRSVRDIDFDKPSAFNVYGLLQYQEDYPRYCNINALYRRRPPHQMQTGIKFEEF